jgi:cadmium resistance protein CadD (predicted permease)
MIEVLTIIAVTASAFIGTNLDNLLLLVAMHAHYRDHPAAVSAGYVSGMVLIGGICMLVSQLDELIPVSYLGLLGIIPLGSGVWALIRLIRKRAPQGVTDDTSANNTAHSIFAVLLMTQLSHGADTIITFSALLADSSNYYDYQLTPVYLAMVACFAWLARYSLKHPGLKGFLERYGGYVTPFILILVGLYILNNTATDLAPGY